MGRDVPGVVTTICRLKALLLRERRQLEAIWELFLAWPGTTYWETLTLTLTGCWVPEYVVLSENALCYYYCWWCRCCCCCVAVLVVLVEQKTAATAAALKLHVKDRFTRRPHTHTHPHTLCSTWGFGIGFALLCRHFIYDNRTCAHRLMRGLGRTGWQKFFAWPRLMARQRAI